jgi:hypothetical protein
LLKKLKYPVCFIKKLFYSWSDFEVLELFFPLSLSRPTDLKNIAEKINNTETTIDEMICGKGL